MEAWELWAWARRADGIGAPALGHFGALLLGGAGEGLNSRSLGGRKDLKGEVICLVVS